MFIIQDWAGNTLQYTGRFNFGRYGNDLGVPMTFDTFHDASEFIDSKYSEYDRQDIYIQEK